jgi:hypothetical protein
MWKRIKAWLKYGAPQCPACVGKNERKTGLRHVHITLPHSKRSRRGGTGSRGVDVYFCPRCDTVLQYYERVTDDTLMERMRCARLINIHRTEHLRISGSGKKC